MQSPKSLDRFVPGNIDVVLGPFMFSGEFITLAKRAYSQARMCLGFTRHIIPGELCTQWKKDQNAHN
jgi:hypothetical protein